MTKVDSDSSAPVQSAGGGRWPVRQHRGVQAKIVTAGAFIFTIFLFTYLLGYLSTGVIFLDEEVFLPLVFGLMITFTFLFYPMRKRDAPSGKIPWYDWLLILITLAGTGYIAVFSIQLILYRVTPTTPEIILGTAVVIAVLESARRTIGTPLAILAIIMVVYAMFTNYMPGPLWGPGFDWSRILGEIWLFQQGLFGVVTRTFFKFIFLFIMLGSMLNFSGAGNFFMQLSLGLAGKYRGGPAKVAVLGSSMLGTMTGSAIANVATTGAITIPMMKKIGYKPYYAGAIETVASTGGQIMPPVMGVTAFVMAEFMEVPYLDICIAAIIPALLFYIALFIQVHIQAHKLGLKGLPKEELPSVWKTFLRGGHFLLPLLVLLYVLAILRYSPTTAATYAIGTLLIVAMFRKESRWTLWKLAKAVEQAVRQNAHLVPVIGCAGIVLACFAVTGLGQALSGMLLNLSGGNTLILLLLTAATAYIFGMGLPSMVAYILLSVMIIPALIQAGIPLYSAHFFVFYFAASHIMTPPSGNAFYVAASIADAPPIRTGVQSMRLGIVVFVVPFAFVYSISLLLRGPLIDIPLVIAWSLVGVTAMAIGLEGYLRGSISWLERVLLIAGGLLLFYPDNMFKVIGAIVIVAGLLPQGIVFIRARLSASTKVKDG